MCVGIPMQLAEPAGPGAAWCEGRDGRTLVDIRLVGEQPAGTWLLVFQRAAREVLDPERARDIAAALEGLEAALRGDGGVERFFADLVDREPELPPHLRKETPRA